MKSRTSLLIIALSASVAFAQTSPQPASTWERWTTVVKVKVQEWISYWNGQPQTQAPAVATIKPPASNPSSPSTPSASATIPSQTVVRATPPTVNSTASATKSATPSPRVLSDENQSLRKQKLFDLDKGSSVADVKALREAVKTKPLLRVAQPGRAGTSKLNKGKDGVPVSDFRKIRVTRSIPRLDIGVETLISREDFGIDRVHFGIGRPGELKRLTSPPELNAAELKKIATVATEKVYGAKGLQANMRTVGQPVNRETVASVKWTFAETNEGKLLPYRPLTEDQLKMLAALILFERGDHCHMIMGLFHQLTATESTRAEARYHLGACANKLKMSQVAFDQLSQLVAAEDKDFGAEALELLAKDLPLIYEKDFYSVLKAIKSFKNLITEAAQDNVAYRMAKGAYKAGDFKTSMTYAGRVSSSSEFYDEARFLIAMNSFAQKDKPAALAKLQELAASLEARKVQDKNLRALVAANLARMYFGQKKYDKAFESYMQVPKDHPLWVQALIEQGWTQLALDDNAGAIGNMYSLHSPYFKMVYQPESFVVRTIGYLNYCQYGDAYKTLTWLERDYRGMLTRTGNYLDTKSEPTQIYNSVKTYIRSKSSDDVEGVPHQVWREMARRKDFLNLQTALNEKSDEAHRYDGVNEKIKSEKASIRSRAEGSKRRFDTAKAQLVNAQKTRNRAAGEELERQMHRERDLTIAYRFQLSILEQSRQGYLDFQSKAQKKLDVETASLTTKAGQCLLKHAKGMKSQMASVLENNEFLRYEVFSGSGENIRYQVAGGNVGNEVARVPAHIKPQKMMNWNFDGEFWEDEIGSYRSSLQNVCPTAVTRQATVGEGEAEQ